MSSRTASQETAANAAVAATKLLSYVSLVVMAVTFLLPLYWMFTGSFKLQQVTMAVPPELIPTTPTLENWNLLFSGPWPIWNWVLNSVIVSSLTVVLVLIVSALTGYGFGKLRFPGSNVLFLILLSTMFLPSQVILVPLFLLVRNLHLTATVPGTWFAMALPLVASPFGIFLVKQFCSSIPDELLDAARIDGASEWRIFRQIVVPLSGNAMGALGIFAFIQAWSIFIWPLIIATTRDMFTMEIGLVAFRNQFTIDYGGLMAGSTISILPIVIVFLLLRRQIIEGVTLTGLKG